jgi:hypothetical protein
MLKAWNENVKKYLCTMKLLNVINNRLTQHEY